MSDVESDTEKGSSDDPGFVDARSDHTDQIGDVPKPRMPKVTSDSFISELVSDRGPKQPAVPEEDEKTVSGEGEEGQDAPCAVLAVPPSSQAGSPLDPQWSNVDLEEAQGQQAQAGPVPDGADTCSLSSVATYTLAMEDTYGADEHPLWAWVSGGGCSVDSHSQLSWFNCSVNAACECEDRHVRVLEASVCLNS